MRTAFVTCGALLLATCTASAAAPVRVALGARPAAVMNQPWTAALTIRPRSFRGAVRVTAAGPGRITARAVRTKQTYRVRLLFPAAGRWTLTARAGGSTSRLGALTVRGRPPLRFAWPTSVDVRPDGSLLVVENGAGRVLAVHPATGRTRVLAAGLDRPFAAVDDAAGNVYVSGGPSLRRIDASGASQTVATADEDLGPLAVGENGDIVYASRTRLFRLPAGGGDPRTVATGLTGPHGVAVAADGAVLVSDTANGRVLRIDRNTGAASTLIETTEPRGIDIADDGTIYVVEPSSRRVGRFAADGTRLGVVGPVFGDPYDVVAGPGGVVYVVDTAASGVIRRVAANGAIATVPTG